MAMATPFTNHKRSSTTDARDPDTARRSNSSTTVQYASQVLFGFLMGVCLLNIYLLSSELHHFVETASSPLTRSMSAKRELLETKVSERRFQFPVVWIDDTFDLQDGSEDMIEYFRESEDAEESGSEDVSLRPLEAMARDQDFDQPFIYPEDSSDLDDDKPRKAAHARKEDAPENGAKVGRFAAEDSPDEDLELEDYEAEATEEEKIANKKEDFTDKETLSLSDVVQKQGVLDLLHHVGVMKLTPPTVSDLPTDAELSFYYKSSKIVVIGMESCDDYRHTIPVDDMFPSVAGLFNTGTNALAWSLRKNIPTPLKARWQVPWGKHRLASSKWNHTVPDGLGQLNKTNVLPIVVIKDPFTWLQSMCSSPYEAHWRHREAHCPNLVPNEFDRQRFRTAANGSSMQVEIHFDNETKQAWPSLIHLWNDWYRQYLDADYPRLIVRFEDFLFRPSEILKHVATCMGVSMPKRLLFHPSSAKAHGSHTDLVHAFIKYGKAADFRFRNMTREDLHFAKQTLDVELMTLFHYPMPELDSTNS